MIYKVITLDIRSDKGYDFSSEMVAGYHKLEDAIKCVETNACDIQDCAYNYAMISSSVEGCYGFDDKELYGYRGNKDSEKGVQISLNERPKACEQLHISS